KIKTNFVREPGRSNEIGDQPIEVVVVEHGDGGREPAVENRIGLRGERLGTALDVRPREPAGMGQLEADEEIGIGRRSKPLPVRARCDRNAAGDLKAARRGYVRGLM